MGTPVIGDIFEIVFKYTEEEVKMYAQISGDVNPIHVEEDYGKLSQFGACIVHGYFSISIFSKIYGTLLYPENHVLISQKMKYIKPIFTNTIYKAIVTVVELIPEKNRVLYLNEIYDLSGELKTTGEAELMNKNYYQWK